MASTFTASTAIPQPRAPHTGVQAAIFRYSSSTTAIGTSSDAVYLCKVPNKAMVLDMRARVRSINDGSGELRMYLTKGQTACDTSTLATIASLSISVTVGRQLMVPSVAFAPFQLSITDATSHQYAWLKIMFLNSSATVSFSIDGHILYAMNVEQ